MKYPCLIIFFVVTCFRHVIAVCTPQNKADLILARDGCLGETADGSCPKFAARSNSNGCGADSGVGRHLLVVLVEVPVEEEEVVKC